MRSERRFCVVLRGTEDLLWRRDQVEEVEVCPGKVSRGKTEYMCVDEKETGLAVKLPGLEVVKGCG